MRLFTSFSGKTPLAFNYFMGKVMGSIAYRVVIRHRRIALEGLSIAFPKKSLKERKKIARDFFIFMAQGSFELLHFLKNPHKLQDVRIDGRENLNQALEKKRGVIILTAHLGNFPLMSLKLAKEGYPVYFVTRPMRDQKTSDYIHKLRTDAGVKTIFSYPRRECVSEIIRVLASNGIIVMQMDQNFGSGGVRVKFFNKLAATPVGPIVLALRTKALIVPAYIYREGKGRHRINIFPQKELLITDDKDETILLNVIEFTRIIEDWIERVGFQWGWIHRRWKSRPSEKVKGLRFKVEQ
jgi:KDO2-lipid IV(A) lauroyltransferase